MLVIAHPYWGTGGSSVPTRYYREAGGQTSLSNATDPTSQFLEKGPATNILKPTESSRPKNHWTIEGVEQEFPDEGNDRSAKIQGFSVKLRSFQSPKRAAPWTCASHMLMQDARGVMTDVSTEPGTDVGVMTDSSTEPGTDVGVMTDVSTEPGTDVGVMTDVMSGHPTGISVGVNTEQDTGDTASFATSETPITEHDEDERRQNTDVVKPYAELLGNELPKLNPETDVDYSDVYRIAVLDSRDQWCPWDIGPNEEVFVNYSKKYWQQIGEDPATPTALSNDVMGPTKKRKMRDGGRSQDVTQQLVAASYRSTFHSN
ncbi:hypothetical protein FOZ60_008664 [Perkinsus olseni]|uniref:Uncharacterized protein n=1 Tax=Perkinsus olseni TaxID=32597 RepID=A0A7J6NJ83_PEROL|nr:hypothetical protein FOZ60_008664 [Perkinsus olseni]